MTATINEQLHKVLKDSGVNMFDRRGVQAVANDLNLYELVCWLEDIKNRAEFVAWISGEATIEGEATQ